MSHCSAFSVFRKALLGTHQWSRTRRSQAPEPVCDMAISGAGGHWLAPAFLARSIRGIICLTFVDITPRGVNVLQVDLFSQAARPRPAQFATTGGLRQ